jgi:hypothetical protein
LANSAVAIFMWYVTDTKNVMIYTGCLHGSEDLDTFLGCDSVKSGR